MHCIPSILRFSLFFLFRRKVIRVYSTLALIRLRIVRGVYRGCELNLSYKWDAVIMTTYYFGRTQLIGFMQFCHVSV